MEKGQAGEGEDEKAVTLTRMCLRSFDRHFQGLTDPALGHRDTKTFSVLYNAI